MGAWPLVAPDGDSPTGRDLTTSHLPTLLRGRDAEGRTLWCHKFADQGILEKPFRQDLLTVRADDEALSALHLEQGEPDLILETYHPSAIAGGADLDRLIQYRHRPRCVELAEAHREGSWTCIAVEVVPTDPTGIDMFDGVSWPLTEGTGSCHSPSISHASSDAKGQNSGDLAPRPETPFQTGQAD